jgi:ketosteroid isomerase-like protein
MSQENVERAWEAYGALGIAAQKGDLDAFFREYVHPEIEWVPLEGAPDIAVSRGHEAVKGRMMAMLDIMDEPQIEAEEIIDAGESVVVVTFRMSGRGRGSGMDVEASMCHVVTERDNKAVRIEWHGSRAEALEAAGLSE